MIELGLEIGKISFTVNGEEAISKAKSILEAAIDSIKGNQKKSDLQPCFLIFRCQRKTEFKYSKKLETFIKRNENLMD